MHRATFSIFTANKNTSTKGVNKRLHGSDSTRCCHTYTVSVVHEKVTACSRAGRSACSREVCTACSREVCISIFGTRKSYFKVRTSTTNTTIFTEHVHEYWRFMTVISSQGDAERVKLILHSFIPPFITSFISIFACRWTDRVGDYLRY